MATSGKGLLRLYRELWRLARGQRAVMAAAFALLFGSQMIRLVVPYFSGQAINALQLQGLPGLGTAGLWLLGVFAATVAAWLLHGPGRILERNVALRVRERSATELMQRLLDLPLSWHEARHSAATTHRLNQSTHAIYDFAQTQFIYLQQAVQLVGPVAALWLIEPRVGAAALFGLAVISLSLTRFDRAMIRLAVVENESERRYAAATVDTLGNIVSVHALRQCRGVLALLERRLQAVFVSVRRGIVINEGKWCAVDVLSMALSCSLLVLFAWLSLRGIAQSAPVPAQAGPTPTLPLGNVYMVWEYALRAGSVISGIAAHYQTFARQQADYASGDEIRRAAPAAFASPATTRAPAWRRLEIRALTFVHEAGRGSGLVDVGFTLERGRRYALIGGSGSGKTTLLRVLAGLYLPQQLQLAVDGAAAVDDPVAALRWLRATTTLIPQDAEVFEGSLAENLALCDRLDGAPAEDRYAEALATACATDFLAADAAGLAATIAERGANWSGGQRQRVSLARGVLAAQGSGLVLLDEPTASLDPATEQRVYAQLFAAFPEACLISSVHRLNLLDRFDAVLLMADGRLVDHGSVAELSARSEAFRALLAAQRHDAQTSPIAPA